MQHSELRIGGTFWCGGRQWRCSDIGTRTAIAIRIDSVDVASTNPELRRTLGQAEAEAGSTCRFILREIELGQAA